MKVPKFKNVKEAREFWITHDSMDYHDDFKITKDVVFVRPKKEVLSLRLEPKIIQKLKDRAESVLPVSLRSGRGDMQGPAVA